ncbi:hypothetical protein GCM10009720_16230 [Yaniella flava]|uniref:Uncharacterized protein n=1 Tax=Yaniella flava TaxID=287930 RepID=A0ABP5FY36_9MICC|nr:hypothetical protein [Micrococcaceae bacterium]
MTQLHDLTVGDQVLVKRNLDHPVHQKFVDDEYGGGWVADSGVEEIIGVQTITERKDTSDRSLVRLSSGFWYDLSDGYQDGARANVIEALPEH